MNKPPTELEALIREIVKQHIEEMFPPKELISPEEREAFAQKRHQIKKGDQ
jgi:hypothetical protein